MLIQADAYAPEERANMRGGEGTVSIFPLAQEERPANCRLFSRIELPPGASIGYHVHEGETELFYFLSGKGQAQDDEALADVAPGMTMITASGHGHAVFNTGEEPLVMLACIVLDG